MSMIVIQHDLSGEKFNYNTQTVTDDQTVTTNYTLPKGYSLASDQTPVDQYKVFLVEAETGQYVETTKWPIDMNPLD
jgi:hypothetical protein